MSKGAEYERCLSRICQSEAAFLQQKRPSKAQQFVCLIVFLGNRLSAWSNTLDIADILRCLNQIMECLLLAFLTSFISCYRKDSCTTFFQIGVLLSLGKGDESLQRCHGCNSSLRAKKTFGIFSVPIFVIKTSYDSLSFGSNQCLRSLLSAVLFQVCTFVGLWSCCADTKTPQPSHESFLWSSCLFPNTCQFSIH